MRSGRRQYNLRCKKVDDIQKFLNVLITLRKLFRMRSIHWLASEIPFQRYIRCEVRNAFQNRNFQTQNFKEGKSWKTTTISVCHRGSCCRRSRVYRRSPKDLQLMWTEAPSVKNMNKKIVYILYHHSYSSYQMPVPIKL